MAFRQPTTAPILRPISTTPKDHKPAAHSTHSQSLSDSREWILFPSRASAASYTQATSTDRTPRTAGLSRLSDFGSLNTAARSSRQSEDDRQEELEGSLEEEDEGLDSLDEGLHAFQTPSKLLSEHFHVSGGSILPRHDGLGGFPSASTPGLDERGEWREESGSRKRSFGASRRRDLMVVDRGVQETVPGDGASLLEEERRERIERWRLEHSRVLLDEVEKVTRRRRASLRSRTTAHGEHGRRDFGWGALGGHDHDLEDQRSETSLGLSINTQTRGLEAEEDNETFWQRVTRRVIRDYIGIDDTTLSIILGESLPQDTTTSDPPPSKAPRLDTSIASPTALNHPPTWDTRLLNRVTRELHLLLDQLSQQPTTPLLFTPPPPDNYAGIPLPHITTPPPPPQTTTVPQPIQSPPSLKSPTSFTFAPTLPTAGDASTRAHAALWGIEEEPLTQTQANNRNRNQDQNQDLDPDQDPEQAAYWHSPPTLREIFTRFLRSRFPPPTSIPNTSTQT